MKEQWKRWSQWGILGLAVVFVGVFIGDWAVFALRGSPQGKIAVHRYVTVPLKGNKKQYDYLGVIDVPCSRSLFPQAGESPCWLLRRNLNQGIASQ